VKPRALLLAAVVLAGAGLCARLGLWQLSRWHWKQAMNARMRQAEASPPLASEHAPPLGAIRGRYLALTGRYDEGHQIVIGGHVREDVPGVEVITPLVLEDGTAVLVDRGWIPVAEAGPVSLAPYGEPGLRRVVGYPESLLSGRRVPPLAVRASPQGTVYWGRDLDRDTLAARLPYRLAAYSLRQAPGPGVPARPVRSRPEPLDVGLHLGYAIQWFSFGLILLGGSAWLAWQRRPSSPLGPKSPPPAGLG
jgi:surfeit locus 1 family protein